MNRNVRKRGKIRKTTKKKSNGPFGDLRRDGKIFIVDYTRAISCLHYSIEKISEEIGGLIS